MAWLNRKFGAQAVLRSVAILTLTAMFLMQALLPASASNAMDCHTSNPIETQCTDDCSVHAAHPDGATHANHQTEGETGSTMQCMPSISSLHVSINAPMPVPVGMLLSTDPWIDDRTVFPSLSASTQDRPPQNV